MAAKNFLEGGKCNAKLPRTIEIVRTHGLNQSQSLVCVSLCVVCPVLPTIPATPVQRQTREAGILSTSKSDAWDTGTSSTYRERASG